MNIFFHFILDGTIVQLQETFGSLCTLFNRPEFQSHFELMAKLKGNRAISKRIKLYHKATDTICLIHLGLNSGMADTSQIIRNCILHAPICKDFFGFSMETLD